VEQLLECVLDLREGRVQLAPDTLHDRDDRNGDAGGNQAILDGGGASLVLDEAQYDAAFLHGRIFLQPDF
jgi:hypothetical protein